ncbi:MAG: ABC transporter ATP-binding protein/permease [Gammaproteobacteria bacterium]|nr:ABC transporter ATP-binding protein/permease [Gammaproteobacteria bacterium]MBU2057234.1 ABC transporter ATP-binding protein/permease [Gammaproteobacteria bacterium]MBU2174836.1 ABC transporter ATP-binding protein/permease [Gammaproteobacteria bacterium]MBU2245441.1 ABC transporter ATP-binding protein/permease [Gammaproteobacteria bacterium]MBU2344222.1 ABC transporter ATP-binding protein/permease [Gammaproteobacteria bacterium]
MVVNTIQDVIKQTCLKSRLTILMVFLLNLLILASSFAITLTVEQLFNTEINQVTLNNFTAIIIGLLIAFSAATGIRQKLTNDFKERAALAIFNFTINKVLRREQEFFDEISAAHIHSQINYDLHAIKVCIHFVLNILMQSLGVLSVGFIFLFYTNASMTLVSLAIVPVVIIMIFKIGSYAATANQFRKQANSEFDSAFIEGFGGIQSVKVHRIESLLSDTLKSKCEHAFACARKLHLLESLTSTLVIFGSFSSLVLVLWLGGGYVVAGTIQVGELVAFVMVLLLISYSLASISDVSSVYIRSKAALHSLNIFVELPPKTSSRQLVVTQPVEQIRLENLSFSYKNSNLSSLQALNFRFEKNNVYTLIGKSGSGKTTLAKLISGLYQSYEGQLIFDEINLAAIDSESSCTQVAIVEQQPFFFKGTIQQNITLHHDCINEDRLKLAVELSCFDQVLEKNQLSLDSDLNTNSTNLSGGERQRLAIARALYSNTNVLILDEATNALDCATENRFYRYLNDIKQNKIVIWITHNLQAIEYSDVVLVMDNGQLAASGSPEQITANHYFKKISAQ